MKVIIIEDELPAARKLERMLNEFSITCVGKFSSVKESIQFLKQAPKLDVIFSDIQLTDGLSFEIFQQVECTTPIIFTTAYDEYAIKAFKLNSIDYLLKPIAKDEMSFALEKLQQNKKTNSLDLQQLINVISTPPKKSYPEQLLVKIGQKVKLLPVNEIVYFVSKDKASFVVTSDGRSFSLDDSLDKIAEQLCFEHFFRCSRQHIVHKKYLREYLVYSSNRLKLNLNINQHELILVSRDRIRDFKEWLNH